MSAAAISVQMIVKDQPKPAARAIKSLQNLVRSGDEIIIVDTGSSKENLEKLKRRLPKFDGVETRILERPDLSRPLAKYIKQWVPEKDGVLNTDKQYRDLRGLLDFSEARQVALDSATKPITFWIDSDDVLVEQTPGRLRQIVDKGLVGDDAPYSALFLDYEYTFAEDGTLTTVLRRERFALTDKFHWRGRCHETLIPLPNARKPVGYCEDSGAVIRHTEARKGPGISDVRNYIILKKELDDLGPDEAVDPRTLLYLGNACRGLGRWQEAIHYYKVFDGQSGSFEDRFAACLYIGQAYMHESLRRPLDAFDWFQKASEIKPNDPRAYFEMARACCARYRWQEALRWFNLGRGLPEPRETTHSYNPSSVNYDPYLSAAYAALELEQPDLALELIQIAGNNRPENKDGNEILQSLQNRAAGQQLSKSVMHVAAHVEGSHGMKRDAARELVTKLPAVPEELERTGVGALPTPDPREFAPEFAIFCGQTDEAWGPLSAKTGIGGSEKMVLLLAPLLQRAGWNVTVYANVPPNQRGVAPSGVRWLHWSQFDHKKPVDVFCVWRNVEAITYPVAARVRVQWHHDVQSPERHTNRVIASTDLVICQSRFHADPIRHLYDKDQILVARNAISPRESTGIEKDPNKIIYLSSPDRGAVSAILAYSKAKVKNPKLNMTVLYGFSPYERRSRTRWSHREIPDLGRDGSLDEYERMFWRAVDAYGVRVLNRVGFDKVWDELHSAGMWVYPTRFPEISCMSAMEAQAAGCVCLTSEYAALAETVLPCAKQLGAKISPDDLEGAAEEILKAARVSADDERRAAQIREAEKAFNVEDLATIWVNALKK